MFWRENGLDSDQDGGVQVGHLVLPVHGEGEAGTGCC